jgi:hydroxyacylglutathione hydrolase
MEAMARTLYRSLAATKELPDYLQLWPGHGAGSACGKSLGAVPSTTLGYERIANWAFQARSEEDFVREVLAGQPEPPRYFAVMKRMNRDGPPVRAAAPMPPTLTLAALDGALAAGTRVVDVRATREFAREHIPGTINIPLGKSFATWAGSFIDYDADLLLLSDDDERIRGALELLRLIGIDRVAGWGDRGLRDAWRAAGRPLASTPYVSAADTASRDGVHIVDVRRESEWEEGHIPGAQHLFLGDLERLSADLSRNTPIVLHCQGGSRSAIAASLLQARGFTNVANMDGGFDAWQKQGLPVEDE